MLDGKRIGSIQVDREWAKANFGFTPIPPGFREPHVTKHPTPRDPCIFAAAGGKCMPDVFKQEPIIRFPNDVREMGVLTRK